jgi:hypothetical protein
MEEIMDSQLEMLLNRLLESERAGHILIDTMSQETADEELKALFANFTDVEVSDTAVLEGLIRLHGGTPSSQTGDFAQKVLQLKTLPEQINRLSQGQAWVARKVEQVLDDFLKRISLLRAVEPNASNRLSRAGFLSHE